MLLLIVFSLEIAAGVMGFVYKDQVMTITQILKKVIFLQFIFKIN